MGEPAPEISRTKKFMFDAHLVGLWILQVVILLKFEVKDRVPDNWHGGEKDVVQLIHDCLIESLSGEATVETEPVLR